MAGTLWTEEERALLRRLRQNGLGATKIGAMMGRSRHSVQRQIRDMGLPTELDPQEPAAARSRENHRAGRSTLPLLASLRQDN